MLGQVCLSVTVAVIALIVGFSFVPLPENIEMSTWTSKSPPAFEGILAPNERLKSICRKVSEGLVQGPESVAVNSKGEIAAATLYGQILSADGSVFVETKGRPLGVQFDSEDNLIIADAVKGLLKVDAQTKELIPLATSSNANPIITANDVAISKQTGIIYFTDATSIPSRLKNGTYDTYGAARLTVMASQTSGRVLKYDPKTKTVETLMKGLVYSNGVALSPDEDFLLVCETGKYRIHKYWLKGPKEGTSEVVADNLPGMPDGIDTGSNGRYWIAMFAPRVPILELSHPYPFLKRIIINAPEFLAPKPKKYGLIVAINKDGEIVDSLHDATGEFAPITSVVEHNGELYLGSLRAPFFAICKLDK